jgi:hypothetical protein
MKFGSAVNPRRDWHNMDTFSFHVYEKTGSQLANIYLNLTDSVNNDSPNLNIPVIVTEHNAHLASTWDNLPSTPDTYN